MMPTEIAIVAGEDSAFAVSPELEGVTLRLAFRWLPRIASWVCLPTLPSGDPFEPVGIQQRVSPNGELLIDSRRTDTPPGRLYFVGSEPVERSDLGTACRLVYLTAAEVEALG